MCLKNRNDKSKNGVIVAQKIPMIQWHSFLFKKEIYFSELLIISLRTHYLLK